MTASPPDSAMENEAPLVAISPARDEAATIERTIGAMRAQRLRPRLWVIVDDGSSDGTAEIARAASRGAPWIRVITREDRGFRQVGAGVIEAFETGLAAVDVAYDYVAKVDVDLEFGPEYLNRLFGEFDADPSLAAISGKVFVQEGDAWVENFMIDEMVAGQFKLYRREAFEEIGGFVKNVMWDGIDFHRARMFGWRTVSLPDAELRLRELRPMGASEGSVYRGRLRWGRGQWFMGSAASYVLASGFFRMRERPRVIGGLLIILGYLLAALERQPRYGDRAFRQELHRWQRERLQGLVRGRGVR